MLSVGLCIRGAIMDHTRQANERKQGDGCRPQRRRHTPTPQERQIELDPTAVVPAVPGNLLSLQTTPGILQSLVIQMQHQCGNQQVTRILAGRGSLVQRLPAAPSLPISPERQAPLVTAPAAGLTPLPEAIRREHQALVSAGNLNGALMVVARHMEARGEIAPQPHGGARRRQRCNSLDRNHQVHRGTCVDGKHGHRYSVRCNPTRR